LILTTQPNALIKPIHNRMPVMLDPSQLDQWVNPPPAAPNLLRALPRPAPDEWLVAEKASPMVNSVKYDGSELLAGLID
jgi:putative SOS response-associated peptidase YedK